MGLLPSMIVGGIAGGIAAYYGVSSMNRAIRNLSCPQCGHMLGDGKPGKRTRQQRIWGGWTCPKCKCDVDRNGKARDERLSPSVTVEIVGLASDVTRLFSDTHTLSEIVRRPYLLVLKPHLFWQRPWLLWLCFSLMGAIAGIVIGAQQGWPHGIEKAIEGALIGGWVVLVVASIIGAVLAAMLWILRTIVRVAFRRNDQQVR